MNKEDYKKQIENKSEMKMQCQSDPYRLSFHMMGPMGWVNDPNGLCQFQGTHHIYFQYTPFSATWGEKIWGHYTTKDYINFKEEEPFLFPDTNADRDGCYSGSAFVEDDIIHYFYTGNVKYTDKEYDYIRDGREQNTIHVESKDGLNYSEKEVVIAHKDYPKDCSCHIRDPKIVKEEDAYYMFLGARDLNDNGLVLIYQSNDLNNWQEHMRITPEVNFGYMWECPDLVEIDGQKFLMVCPQGLKHEQYQFQNVYQSGYFKIDLDLKNKMYTLGEFVEFDMGFDFYAPQTYTDQSNRKICIGWMGLPDTEYHNQLTVDKGWQHALTLPRVLTVRNGYLHQKPIEEVLVLRKNEKHFVSDEQVSLHSSENAIEIKCNKLNSSFKLKIKDIEISFENQILCLDESQCGLLREKRYVNIEQIDHLDIWVDHSSIEIFINHGRYTMTSRFYSQMSMEVLVEGISDFTVFELNPIQMYN